MAERGPGTRPWTAGGLVLLVACSAEFMVVLDASVVNVALPAIGTGLGFDVVNLQWVVNSYAVVFAGFLLLGGRLADLYGRRRAFAAGLILFTGASALGGLATTPAMLIGARAVQALGAAVLAPASLTILTTTFGEGPRRVRALAIWTALASAGGAAGNLLGGVLTEYLSWRSTLLINVPIGVVALLLALGALSADHRQPGTPEGDRGRWLDLPGAIAATVGLSALTYAITAGTDHGWVDPLTVTALGLGLAGIAVFVADERWFSDAPLVPLRLFRNRAITVGNLAMLLAGACLMPMWYFLSLYMQQVLRYSALQTGLGFLPHAVITVVVGAQVAPRLLHRVEGRVLIAVGSLIAAAGFWWQGRLGVDSDYVTAILGPAVAVSAGVGLLNTPLTSAVTSGVTEPDAGAASGLMNTTKQAGGAVGLAALIAATAIRAHPNAATGPAALTAGYSRAFTIMAAAMVIVAILALAVPAVRGNRRPTPGQRQNRRAGRTT